MPKIKRTFRPQAGFGGNPIEKESFWRLTDTMIKRIKRYGIEEDVKAAAKAVNIDNFDVYLATKEIEKRQLGHTSYKATLVEGATPKQHELEIGKILEENGYNILFTPENKFITGMKNPEGIITNLDKIVEMKEIGSPDLEKIEDRIKEAVRQKSEIIVLNLKGDKKYSKDKAIETAEEIVQKILPKRIKNTDKTKLEGTKLENALNMERGLEKLKEVWLIWKGDIIKIKK